MTDPTCGETIAVSGWNVYEGEKPPEMQLDGPPGIWDTEDDKAWAQALFLWVYGASLEADSRGDGSHHL